jgi:hypothetical protein
MGWHGVPPLQVLSYSLVSGWIDLSIPADRQAFEKEVVCGETRQAGCLRACRAPNRIAPQFWLAPLQPLPHDHVVRHS